MNHKILNAKAKRPFLATNLLTLSLLMIVLIIGCNADKNSASLAPPPDFQPLAEIDLSTQPFDGEILGQFAVEETAVITIFYTIPNIDTTEFDLRLNGPNEDSYVILHSENFRTDENGGGTWEQNLAPGTYQVVLTASQTPGTLSVYWTSK
jgi:hypothetical protein